MPINKSTGSFLIFTERMRQINREGYDPEKDRQWPNGELVDAAMAYATLGKRENQSSTAERFKAWSDHWPWDITTFKPKDRLSNLIRAGALIAAEIDRLVAEDERKKR